MIYLRSVKIKTIVFKMQFLAALPVLLAASAGEGSKAWHEEVQPREGHHVDSQFSQVSIELARKAQAGGHPTHGG